MKRTSHDCTVLERYADLAALVPEAQMAGDADRNALGFLPKSVFEEFARKGCLLVATVAVEGRPIYAGHLLYDARLPKARVLQLHVASAWRKQGIGGGLLTRLKEQLTALSYTSIYASVAEDLIEANHFWQSQGFLVQRQRAGGRARGRTILVRCFELDSPQLFAKSGVSVGNLLGLDVGLRGERPIYLLDLNVLFDLGPRRERHEPTIDVFRAERHGAVQLGVSTELRDELARSCSTERRSDPMQAWAAIFIAFPVPGPAEGKRLLHSLAGLVFGERGLHGAMSANDLSDLKHLATAIHHRLAGFITNDNAILAASKQLEAVYGIQVVSPLAFRETQTQAAAEGEYESHDLTTLAIGTVLAEDEQELRSYLQRTGVADADAVTLWGAMESGRRSCSRWAVRAGDNLVGYLVCPMRAGSAVLTARLVVEDGHAASRGVALLLLRTLMDHSRADGLALIRLELPARQASAREVAAALGFARSDDGTVLSKVALHAIVVEETWPQIVRSLKQVCGLRLPDLPPSFTDAEQQVELYRADGNRVFMSWASLEAQLSPALFCLSGRSAVMTPIQRRFAERLFDHSPQASLLPRARASLFAERHYISSERALRHFQRGALILFYESTRDKGAGAVVAIARVQRAYLKPSENIGRDDLDPSVLDAETLGAIGNSPAKAVTAFDNLTLLPRPVPLTSLQRLGCGAATQLLSTRPITAGQLRGILQEGLGHA